MQLRDFSTPAPDLNGKSILVTGGTGSFGKAFIRRVLDLFEPRRVVVFSRDELKQYDMQHEFGVAERKPTPLRFFLGDVRDAQRLEMAMRGIDYVIHAAALKHVPAAEYNPFECIHTNVLGAENVVQAAIKNDVRGVIALSTDKAASPINLYGASKLASDKIFVAANSLSSHDRTRFCVVRYGNVVGSRGSVVPYFRKLIDAGANDLPVTDARMTRFWITLGQGVDFVLSCIAMMRGGEIFVPKIPTMRIADLARGMAPKLPHRIVGIRPGEKLHEVMITEDDARLTLNLGDRYVITPAFPFWTDVPYRNNGASPVAEGFRYASDNNEEWLDEAGFHAMLAELDASPAANKR